jgi:putative transposase
MIHNYNMREMYSMVGISKQAMWKHRRRQQQVQETTEQIVSIMNDIRLRHKRMGCRTMYYATQEKLGVGRDVFERIGFANGFKLKRKPNKQKTTWSQKIIIYPNLIEGKILNGINQVWQSDIFYIKVQEHDYYAMSIEDVYSRRLLALYLAKDMRAIQLEKALKQALRVRRGMDLTGCIFHSDRGSQYISQLVRTVLLQNNMQISMCKMPQENAYVERIQGTLQHQYLFEADLKEKNLGHQIRNIMQYYNNEKPHINLNRMTPIAFEQYVEKLEEKNRPKMQIYKWDEDLSTNTEVIDKKEKRSKKEKSQQKTLTFDT